MIPLSTDPIKSARRWAAVCGILLGLVIIAGTGLYIWGMQRKVEKLEAANTIAVATGAADEAWRQGHITYTKDREEAKNATEQVLERNRDWADQPVPSDVADRLRKHPDAAR